MTALVAVLAGLVGLGAGTAVNRGAGRFPWPPRGGSGRGNTSSTEAGTPSVPDRTAVGTTTRVAVRPPFVELVTAVLFVLAALRFGPSWELPAFLHLAGVGVLLAVIDLQHRLLPNRVVGPAIGISAALLAVAALGQQNGTSLLRALVGGVVLFAAFLLLALISPSGMGMGDVKLSALLGLHLGWLGWSTLLLGAMAGFVVQAAIAVVLLLTRRIDRRGELPFGPAMLLGAAAAIGWSALAG